MRRKLLCLSAAMIIGIWAAEINLLIAVGITLTAFFCSVRLNSDDKESSSSLESSSSMKSLSIWIVIFLLIGEARLVVEDQRYRQNEWINSDKTAEVVAEVLSVDRYDRVIARLESMNGKRVNAVSLITLKQFSYKEPRSQAWQESDGKHSNNHESDKRNSNNHESDDKNSNNHESDDRDNNNHESDDQNKSDALIDLIGRRIKFRSALEAPDTARNPRCFDYREYLKSRGIGHVSKVSSYKILSNESGTLSKGRSLSGGAGNLFSTMKRELFRFRESIIAKIPGDRENSEKTLLIGVLFGETDDMSDEMKENFRKNGTAHILAVSGLHIGLLYSVFAALRKRTGWPFLTPLFLMILLIFGTLTLWSVSVTRACLMVFLVELGAATDRRYDLLTSLGSVSMLSLLHNPYALFGTSFQMSYLAVLSIGMISPVVRSKLPEQVPRSIIASISVQIGLLPYTAYTFNMLPLGSLIINIPVIALISVLVTCAAAAIFTFSVLSIAAFMVDSVVQTFSGAVTGGPIFDALSNSGIITALVDLQFLILTRLAAVIVYINSWFADFDLLSPEVTSPSLILLAAFYIGIVFLCSEEIAVLRIRSKRNSSQKYTQGTLRSFRTRVINEFKSLWKAGAAAKYAFITGVILMALAGLLSHSDFDDADIVMVDVGQGDSMHFRFSRGAPLPIARMMPFGTGVTDVMIDGGGSEDYNIGKNTLKPYLLKNEVLKLDLAYATHLHTDHYKGLTELQAEGMIQRLMTEGRAGDVIRIDVMPEIISRIRALFRGSHENNGSKDDTSNYIEIIYPDVQDKNTDDENKNSLIFKVHINGATVLITGDLGEEGELALVDKYKGTGVLDCDILKVCHHGSKYSSSPEFIDAVSPAVALIGVGKNNMYGHPSSETIRRLETSGAAVYRTDRDGAIAIKIVRRRGKGDADSTEFEVRTMKG